MTIYFPDVSSYNASAHIALGTSVVVARATISDTLSDSQFPRFRREAEQVGAFFVGYHWLNRENAQSQAHWAKYNVGRTPLMVDADTNHYQRRNPVPRTLFMGNVIPRPAGPQTFVTALGRRRWEEPSCPASNPTG